MTFILFVTWQVSIH